MNTQISSPNEGAKIHLHTYFSTGPCSHLPSVYSCIKGRKNTEQVQKNVFKRTKN